MYLKESTECESQITVQKSVRIMCVATPTALLCPLRGAAGSPSRGPYPERSATLFAAKKPAAGRDTRRVGPRLLSSRTWRLLNLLLKALSLFSLPLPHAPLILQAY
jgi:hypothetical protein